MSKNMPKNTTFWQDKIKGKMLKNGLK